MAFKVKGYVPKVVPMLELESPDGTETLEIRCHPAVPGSFLLDAMAKISGGEEDMGAMAAATREVIDMCINPEDVDKFWAWCNIPEMGIGLEQLGQIAEWLSETLSGERPTEPSVPSLAG